MGAAREVESVDGEDAGGIVIPFPTNRTAPRPLPPLPRAIPTPGAGGHRSAMFEAALTKRFDRMAA